MISNGTLITLQNSKLQGTIGVLLGSGSQGEVYSFDIQDNRYAAKVYFLPTSTPDQIEIIRRLIDIKPPSERFLWPIDMFYTEDNRFGYIMSIRGKEYKSLSGLLKGQYDPSFLTLIECSLNLVKSFWSLHSQGLCYRDISLGNIFFNPKNGDIRICDNDNVFFDTKEKSGVFGTFRFMAPEIITKGLNPNTNTDLFSLSVLLFYILYMHHPLEGQREYNIHCLDIPAMKKLYGTHPVYIFDPDDDSNRPMIGYQDNPVFFFKTYPTFFNRMFEKVFTEGITKPNRRVRETIMQKTLLKLLNTLYKCPFCHSDNFLDSEKEKNVCWKCKKPIDPPFVLRYDQEDIPIVSDQKIVRAPKDTCLKNYDVLAKVVKNPKDPTVLGLQNLSDKPWQVLFKDKSTTSLQPKKTIRAKKGLMFYIEGKEAIFE